MKTFTCEFEYKNSKRKESLTAALYNCRIIFKAHLFFKILQSINKLKFEPFS